MRVTGENRTAVGSNGPAGGAGWLLTTVSALAVALIQTQAVLAQDEIVQSGPIAVAQTEQTYSFDMTSKPLPQALAEVSAVTGLQILYSEPTAGDHVVPVLQGSYTARQALDRLVAGSAFQYRYTGANAVTLERRIAREESGPQRLAPVTVTARRTEELLQDVPGSVVVLTDEEIERSNIDSTAEATLRLPNVSFSGNASPELNFSIRGVSNFIFGLASGPTNGIFQNGVLLNPLGLTSGANGATVDLERVEVAYGPQGTAYGRGTIGGAINFVTRKPSNEFEASLEGEVGSFPDGRGTAILNLPVVEEGLLSARLVAFGGASDGFIDFQNETGPDSNGTEDYGFRLSLRSRPTNRLTLDSSLTYDVLDYDADPSATRESIEDGDPATGASFIGEDSVERLIATFEGSYDFDTGTMRSTTSFLRTGREIQEDVDFSPLDFSVDTFDVDEQAIAQEFRFESESVSLPSNLGEASVNIGTSVSFNESDLDGVTDPGADAFAIIGQQLGLGPLPDDGSLIENSSAQEVFNVGVFGDLRWRPIPKLELAAGARFNRDRVEVTGGTESSGISALTVPPVPFQTQEAIFTAVTPNASIKYNWSDDFSTYLAFSTGFRAGGFSATNFGFSTFDEESVRSYEAGFRARFFDDRLQLSGSGYYLDYDDIQVVSFQVVNGVPLETVENAATARSVGAEIGLALRPLDGLTIETQTGLNFSKFTDFEDSPFGDLSGERLPNAPRYTLSVVGDYEHPDEVLPGATAFGRVEYSYRSATDILLNPAETSADGFGLLNFRVGLRGERFSLEGFVENALNTEAVVAASPIATASFTGAGQELVIEPTRRFGLRARIEF